MPWNSFAAFGLVAVGSPAFGIRTVSTTRLPHVAGLNAGHHWAGLPVRPGRPSVRGVDIRLGPGPRRHPLVKLLGYTCMALFGVAWIWLGLESRSTKTTYVWDNG